MNEETLIAIKQHEDAIKKLKEDCKNRAKKTIIIDNLEIETKLHTEMNRMSLIKIPEGWRLLTFAEFQNIYNNHKDKFDFENLDEVIQNPFPNPKYPYWNIWLSRLDRDSSVGGNRLLLDNFSVRGVRFCREVLK